LGARARLGFFDVRVVVKGRLFAKKRYPVLSCDGKRDELRVIAVREIAAFLFLLA
jgi:hypothetical protein